MAQKYLRKGYLEIGIIDNGISIPGSYEKKDYNFTGQKNIIDINIPAQIKPMFEIVKDSTENLCLG